MAKALPSHLLNEWDYQKNHDVDPSAISGGSGRSFYWVCSLGHSWKAVVKNRSKGTGCPYCSGTKVLTGFNDLATVHPELVQEWDHDKNSKEPTEINYGSSKKAFWKCSQGHSWQAHINSRRNGHGCPYCSGNRAITGVNDFSTTYPELAQEWDHERNELSPSSITRSSGYDAHWLCELGHSWKAKVNNRVLGSGCPYCTGRKVLTGFNDITTTHPDVAVLWDKEKNGDHRPEDYSKGSHYNAWWVCPEGHSWENTVTKVISSNGSCPICKNKRVLPGFNDLETVNPGIAGKWDIDKNGHHPSEVLAGSSRRAWWSCDRGHSYEAYVYAQTRPLSGCPRCAMEDQTSSMENDFHSWLETVFTGTIRRNVRGLIGRDELDFYLPERNIAIEFNGLYWHSEERGKYRDYHHSKWKRCRDTGIQLITVWEDDWRDRRYIVTSMISHKIGVNDSRRVYARNTTIVSLNYTDASHFLDSNHVQGEVPGSLYLGLKDGDDIVAVSVWRKNGHTLYLDRYATSTQVIGGMGKLLKAGKHWAKAHNVDKIVTFADHEVSNGGLYEKLGFTLDKELAPDYSYVVNNKRTHKFNYRKKRFLTDPQLNYIEGLTEEELARLNGLPRVWDSGKSRYFYNVT